MDPEKTLFDEPAPNTDETPTGEFVAATETYAVTDAGVLEDAAPELHNGGLFAGNGQDISSIKG